MTEPSSKSVPMSEFLEKFSGRTTAITSDMCIPSPLGCGKPIKGTIRDEVEAREYAISGMCGNCQREVFDAFSEEGN